MTNKEAIEHLNIILLKSKSNKLHIVTHDEEIALDLAINALKERQQGEWINTGHMEEYWAEEYQCSICGEKDHWRKYCPNCGARMEADNDRK